MDATSASLDGLAEQKWGIFSFSPATRWYMGVNSTGHVIKLNSDCFLITSLVRFAPACYLGARLELIKKKFTFGWDHLKPRNQSWEYKSSLGSLLYLLSLLCPLTPQRSPPALCSLHPLRSFYLFMFFSSPSSYPYPWPLPPPLSHFKTWIIRFPFKKVWSYLLLDAGGS